MSISRIMKITRIKVNMPSDTYLSFFIAFKISGFRIILLALWLWNLFSCARGIALLVGFLWFLGGSASGTRSSARCIYATVPQL